MPHSKKDALYESDSEDDRLMKLLQRSESSHDARVEADYATKPNKSSSGGRRLSDKQLENLRKMRENKQKKSNERKANKQEEDYINKLLTEKEDILLERLRNKLQKEGRSVDVVHHDEPVKPKSSIKPPKEYTHPIEPPKAKEPEAPEPPPPQKPINPFLSLF